MNTRFRMGLLGFALLSAFSASGTLVTYSGTGGNLPDRVSGDVDPGFADFDITIPATSATVNSIVSVTLTGLTHTWVGDTQAYLIDPLYDGTIANAAHAVSLFSPPDDDGANFNGTYTFVVDPTKQIIDQASAGQLSAYDIPGGTYAISDYGGGTDPGPRTDFTGSVGAPVAGVWTLEIIDYYPGDTGALVGWSITLDQGEVPEPAALGLVGLLGLAVRRHRA